MSKAKHFLFHSHGAKQLRASIAVGASTLIVGLLATSPTIANDINMHPAGCQAPFLDQAFPMRWHEFYLMNPATNQSTWVICPTTWDEDVVAWTAGSNSNVRIQGAVQTGASSDVPLCFFGAVERSNLELPPYISIPGAKKTFLQVLSTTKSAPNWNATTNVSHNDIRAALGNTPQNWAVSLFCKLPAGHAISYLAIVQ